MNPGIFLIQDNEELIEMTEQIYESEKLLQAWLNQINAKEPKRFLLAEQECGVPARDAGADRWSIDHFFIDQDAIPTIVDQMQPSIGVQVTGVKDLPLTASNSLSSLDSRQQSKKTSQLNSR
jgi:hypothetical protein